MESLGQYIYAGDGKAFHFIGPSHLDPHCLALEIRRGAEGCGSCVEVEQGSSGQGKQGDDGCGGQRGEQQLEEDLHDRLSVGEKVKSDDEAPGSIECIAQKNKNVRLRCCKLTTIKCVLSRRTVNVITPQLIPYSIDYAEVKVNLGCVTNR